LVEGNTKKFYEAAIFSKTYKIIPKHVVYYSIGSHSTQLVLFTKISTIFSISTSLNSCLSSVKAWVSYSSSADSGVFSARCITLPFIICF